MGSWLFHLHEQQLTRNTELGRGEKTQNKNFPVGRESHQLQARYNSPVWHFTAVCCFTLYGNICFPFHLLSVAVLVCKAWATDKSSYLSLSKGQSPTGIINLHLHIKQLLLLLFTDRSANRGCDGNWWTEPESLPCSEGSSRGPALPQHPLRFTFQTGGSTEGPQRERRGQLIKIYCSQKIIKEHFENTISVGKRSWQISTLI